MTLVSIKLGLCIQCSQISSKLIQLCDDVSKSSFPKAATRRLVFMKYVCYVFSKDVFILFKRKRTQAKFSSAKINIRIEHAVLYTLYPPYYFHYDTILTHPCDYCRASKSAEDLPIEFRRQSTLTTNRNKVNNTASERFPTWRTKFINNLMAS